MKICVITDIHGHKSSVKRLLNAIDINKFDLLVSCGDITSFGGRNEAKEILEIIPNINFYTVFGNCDTNEVKDYIDSQNVSLHEKEIKIQDYSIGGFGGSNISPFRTPLEYTEEQIREGLSKLSFRNMILVTHAPPYGTKLDKIGNGKSIGSSSIRKIIEEYHPLVAISGHVHESRAIDILNNTKLLNPGPLKDGYYGIVELNKGQINVSLEKLD
ncbi:MAG: phosphodiesterase [Candidatus Methanofastidiosum methylothiophilum]|uniref:Phosphodiesterase n=1 Tax=Candidatus Methanofastidiosum methylothiophilum TaxID=1705564 RepID=A0A150J767_9EURY|nr:MAG: phosphodiesterase [Candidatus Methanofastidiosum methylthiophilus]NMC76397.1 YfcE family phosphodiesterase [Candidatus Methanofastidiosa archaeon]